MLARFSYDKVVAGEKLKMIKRRNCMRNVRVAVQGGSKNTKVILNVKGRYFSYPAPYQCDASAQALLR